MRLDQPFWSAAILKPQLVPDELAQRHFELLRDARGDRARGNTARLRMTDDARDTAPRLEADLRQLRRLA
jgi:hypothetical protein